jgi:acylphosphatase
LFWCAESQCDRKIIMKPLLSVVLLGVLFHYPVPALAAEPTPTAVSGQVSGKVQKVGFRAMILKQAICFNLAGSAQNHKDGTVEFVLQGDAARIKSALKIIARGTAKSSDVKVKTATTKVDAKLDTFTVVDWTSTSRNITTPYNLVFTLRKDDKKVSEKEAEKEYHKILEKTLSKEDRKKLG